MKRSCLVYLGFFVGIAILASIALLLTIPPAPPGFSAPFVMKLGSAIGIGLAASGFLTLALFGLRDSMQRLSDRARLGMTRRTIPRDGERIVAFGTVVADGPLLESPFTGTRCVCYSYEVRCTTRGRSSTDVLCAWGYALMPSHIEAPWGTVRLLSYTDIDEFPPQLVDSTVRRKAAAYFASTQLEPTGYGAPDLGIAAVKQLHSDQDGSIKGDFGPLPSDFLEGNYRLYEKIIVDREPITAIGTWDSRLGGVKAESGAQILAPVVIRRGPVEMARRTLLRQAIISAIFTLVPLAIAVAIVWWFFRNVERLFY
jgi:hypothetical protein